MSPSPRASYLAYRSLSAAIQALPKLAAVPVAVTAGQLMCRLQPDKRELLRRNARRMLTPAPSEAAVESYVRAAFDSYARYWVEVARLGVLNPSRVDDRWTIEGFDRFEEEMARGKGVIVALPHVGCWEYGALWLSEHDYPMTAVAEVLEPPELQQWFVKQREQLGLTIVPLDGQATSTLLHVLREGRVVGLVADRDLVGTGIEVEFFGEMTTLPPGPAAIALRSGAALIPSAVFQAPNQRFHGVMRPPIDCTRRGRFREDVERITIELAREMEQLILRAPEQWHLFQANWPSDRDIGG